jgi:hypothetical protein
VVDLVANAADHEALVVPPVKMPQWRLTLRKPGVVLYVASYVWARNSARNGGFLRRTVGDPH